MWQFVAGKLPVGEFETWCYQTPELEGVLGKDRYLDLISTRFDEVQGVLTLKNTLYEWLRQRGYPTCECFLWGMLKKLSLCGEWTCEEVESRLELLLQRTNWLELRRCRRCGQAWYVACDTVDDDWYFKRLSEEDVAKVLREGKWPDDFDGQSQYGLEDG
jgi:hypothetical protein